MHRKDHPFDWGRCAPRCGWRSIFMRAPVEGEKGRPFVRWVPWTRTLFKGRPHTLRRSILEEIGPSCRSVKNEPFTSWFSSPTREAGFVRKPWTVLSHPPAAQSSMTYDESLACLVFNSSRYTSSLPWSSRPVHTAHTARLRFLPYTQWMLMVVMRGFLRHSRIH